MTFLVLVALAILSHDVGATVVLVGMLVRFGMSTNPILIGKAVHAPGSRPSTSSARDARRP